MRSILSAALALLCACGSAAAPCDLTPARLRCEMRVNPLNVDATRPRLSWIVTSPVRGARQSAYRVLVASSPEALRSGRGDLWDSGRVASSETVLVPYTGRPLASRAACWWKVRVWDASGRPSGWSEPAMWAMGQLKPSDWRARWIGCLVDRAQADDLTYLPGPMLRKDFQLPGKVRRGMLYITAAGLYDVYINGGRVGADELKPGWTQVDKRLYYQAYDVTGLLRSRSANAIGAMLGDGWYGLHHGGRRRLALRAQLHVDFADGSSTVLATDSSWRATDQSPLRMSDIYNGETYDARREQQGWSLPGFDDRQWKPCVVDIIALAASRWDDVTDKVRSAVRDNTLSIVADNTLFSDPAHGVVKTLRVQYRQGTRVQRRSVTEGETLVIAGAQPLTIIKAEYGADTTGSDVSKAKLEGHPGSPVRRTGILRPVSIKEHRPGVWIFDLGQNFSGWARLRVAGPRGTTVTMRFAEMLDSDGSIYTRNLRRAKCTDHYTLRGGGVEVWEPRFTFHGFRYVEVTGYPGKPGKDAVTGVVLNSDAPITGSWKSSNVLLNKLYNNIVWGQRSNYLEVPTDCPQRDERLGWSGDAQVFVGTGAYVMDIMPFFTAWMRTFNDCQYPEGGYPNVAPVGHGVSPAWGDAGIVCPWTIYTMYGDKAVLADHYKGMQRWVAYLQTRSRDLLRPAEGFGDWLNLGDDTPKDVIATAFFARSADLLSRTATVLGRKEDAARYARLYRDVAAAFTKAYVTDAPGTPEHGRVKGGAQTAQLLALEFDLLPEHLRQPAFGQLLANLERHNWRLAVGFVGVDHLLPVLSRFGRDDVAWRLLTTKEYPSWLYSVTQGATTIWERWDGWRHDRGFQDPGMNSFNHYAFGACGKWMFSTAAGIRTDGPAFRRIVVQPAVSDQTNYVDARYDSVRGPITVAWRTTGKRLAMTVRIPANTTAHIHVPARSARDITESGRAAIGAPGLRYVGTAQGAAIFEAGGGEYRFGSVRP